MADVPPAIVRQAPAAEDHPGEDQVYLEKYIAVSLSPDGRRSYRVRTVRKLFTDHAVRRLSDPRIRYDKARQDLTIHAHHVWTPDGDRIDAPDYARNESQAAGVGNTVDFASVVEVVATQVGARRGAVLVLDYELIDRSKTVKTRLDLDLPLGGDAPIQRLEVSVQVPPGVPFHAMVSPPDERIRTLDVVRNQGEVVHRWQGEDLPAWRVKPFSLDGTPHLVASTWESWSAVVRRYGDGLRATCGSGRDDKLSYRIRQAAGSSGFPSARVAVMDGLRITDNLVLRRFFTPRSLDRVWDTGYATPVEAALVLASIEEVRPDPVIEFSTGDRALVEEVPGLAQWREVRTVLRVPGSTGPIIMTPRTGRVDAAASGFPGAGVLRIRLSPPPDADDPTERVGLVEDLHLPDRPCWTLDEDRSYEVSEAGTIRLALHVVLTKRPDVWLRLATAGDLKDATGAAVVSLLPGGRLERLSVSTLSADVVQFDALVASDAAPGPDARTPLGVLFPPPDDLAGLLHPGEGTTPTFVSMCGRVSQRIRLSRLDAAGVTTDAGGDFHRVFQAPEAFVPPEGASRLRDAVRAWLQDEGRTILLLPIPASGGR